MYLKEGKSLTLFLKSGSSDNVSLPSECSIYFLSIFVIFGISAGESLAKNPQQSVHSKEQDPRMKLSY